MNGSSPSEVGLSVGVRECRWLAVRLPALAALLLLSSCDKEAPGGTASAKGTPSEPPLGLPAVVTAIEPKYDTAAAFSEGLALVSTGTGVKTSNIRCPRANPAKQRVLPFKDFPTQRTSASLHTADDRPLVAVSAITSK